MNDITEIEPIVESLPIEDELRKLIGVKPNGPAPRDPLLIEREKTHGNYHIQGAWAQNVKDMIRQTAKWHSLTGAQQESLDLIITKMSRILHGNPMEKDHWSDISGYAKLGGEACE